MDNLVLFKKFARKIATCLTEGADIAESYINSISEKEQEFINQTATNQLLSDSSTQRSKKIQQVGKPPPEVKIPAELDISSLVELAVQKQDENSSRAKRSDIAVKKK